MSHQFEELKKRYKDLSHQLAVMIDERDNLREALSRIAPSHQEAPKVQCESGEFAPHYLEGLARVGASSSSKVPAVAFPPIPNEFDFGPSPKSGKSQDDPVGIHGTSSYDAISALQEQAQKIIGKRQNRRDKSDSSAIPVRLARMNTVENPHWWDWKPIELKVPGLPKSAAEVRTWKSGVIILACSRSSERG